MHHAVLLQTVIYSAYLTFPITGPQRKLLWMSSSHDWPLKAFGRNVWFHVWANTHVGSWSVVQPCISISIPSTHDVRLDLIVFRALCGNRELLSVYYGDSLTSLHVFLVFSCLLHLPCFGRPVSILHPSDRDIQGQSDHESVPDKRAALDKSVIFSPGMYQMRYLCHVPCSACRQICFSP